MRKFLDEADRAPRLSVREIRLLLAVRDKPNRSTRPIASELGISSQVSSRTIMTLQHRGLLSKRRNPTVAKTVMVSITAKGERRLDRLTDLLRAEIG